MTITRESKYKSQNIVNKYMIFHCVDGKRKNTSRKKGEHTASIYIPCQAWTHQKLWSLISMITRIPTLSFSCALWNSTLQTTVLQHWCLKDNGNTGHPKPSHPYTKNEDSSDQTVHITWVWLSIMCWVLNPMQKKSTWHNLKVFMPTYWKSQSS